MRRGAEHALTSNARVASSAEINKFRDVFSLDVRCESTWNRLLLNFDSLLWRNGFGGAVDDLPTLDESLDQPVVLAIAKTTLLDTVLAQIKVATLTDAAMPVCIWDGLIAMIAANGEGVALKRARPSAGLFH